MIKKYWTIAKATWQEYLAYRGNFFMEVIGGFITQLVIIAVWYSIYQDSGKAVIGGFSVNQMVTYLLGAGIINSLIMISSQGDEINDDINQGDLSKFLAMPLNVPLYWFCRDFSRRILTLLLGLGEYALIMLILSNYLVGPDSGVNLILCVIFVLAGSIMHYLLFYVLSVIAFWMDETWGPRFIIRIIMGIATGAIIPLSLFPSVWKVVLNILPFKFLAYVPMQIYLGKYSGKEFTVDCVLIISWIAALYFISALLWKKGLKKYSAYGN